MNAVRESPFAPPSAAQAAGWRADLRLEFERRGERTVLARRSHVGPLVVQKALYPEGDAVCHAIVVHPPAGIAGGDALAVTVALGPDAHALLTTPGAGKWYRSAGPRARLVQTIAVGAGALCEWLPQESIVFDAARGELVTEVSLAPGARYIGAEMLCFGRTGAGERFASGELALATRITRDGAPLWLERGRVEGGGPLLDAPVALAGEPVCGTLVAVAPECDAALLAACREEVPAAGRGAVTLLPGVLVARYLGPACEPGRDWFVRLWARLRPALAGRAMNVPRIWKT